MHAHKLKSYLSNQLFSTDSFNLELNSVSGNQNWCISCISKNVFVSWNWINLSIATFHYRPGNIRRSLTTSFSIMPLRVLKDTLETCKFVENFLVKIKNLFFQLWTGIPLKLQRISCGKHLRKSVIFPTT